MLIDFLKLKSTEVQCFYFGRFTIYFELFVQAAEVQGNVCQGTVPKLEEGNQYQFRIRALNKAGQSEPSENTNWHTAKARFCKYPVYLLPLLFRNKHFNLSLIS